MSDKKMKKVAEAITGGKVKLGKKHDHTFNVEKKKGACLPEKCKTCPVEKICHGEPKKTLDSMLKDAKPVKFEDLPDEIKKFVSDVKGLGLNIEVEAREIKLEDKPKFFCSHCGKGMIEKEVPAELYGKNFAPMTHLPHKAFDTETGKKRLIKEFVCPRYGFLNRDHDRYSVGQPFTK